MNFLTFKMADQMCSVCALPGDAKFLHFCQGMCGKLVHLACLPPSRANCHLGVCVKCRPAVDKAYTQPSKLHNGDLMNRVLYLTHLVTILVEESQSTKQAISGLSDRFTCFNFAQQLSRGTNSDNQRPRLDSVASMDSTRKQTANGRSSSKRPRLNDGQDSWPVRRTDGDGNDREIPATSRRPRRPHTVGTGSAAVAVPVAAPPERPAQVFISRVAAGVSAATILDHARTLSRNVIAVVKLKTPEYYSSFVIKVIKEDEPLVSALTGWRSGTLIKPFLGRVFQDRIAESAPSPPAPPASLRPLASTSAPAAATGGVRSVSGDSAGMDVSAH